jgi:hypothetical protein
MTMETETRLGGAYETLPLNEKYARLIAAYYRGDRVPGCRIKDMACEELIYLPPSVKKVLAHEDTYVSQTTVVARGIARALGARVHAAVTVAMWTLADRAGQEQPQLLGNSE